MLVYCSAAVAWCRPLSTVAARFAEFPLTPDFGTKRATTIGFDAVDWSAAHQAVERGDLVRLRELLDAGHDVEDDNGDGWTLLCHAMDAEVDARDQTGRALHVDVTALLLARGADPLRGYNGVPVVVEAETRGHWLAVELMRAWINRQPGQDQ